jgi:hypothetical protein
MYIEVLDISDLRWINLWARKMGYGKLTLMEIKSKTVHDEWQWYLAALNVAGRD